MKRFVTMCAVALALLAFESRQASAWSKFGFSVGMNIGYEKADNNFGWGLYRSGPHPFAQGGGYYGGDSPIEGYPAASRPMAPMTAPAQPTLPMPQGVAPATYWAPAASYYWIGN